MGLLVGDPKKKVDKILVALDASDQVLDQAEAVGADMLLTHHPLIFSPVKNVREDDFIGWRIRPDDPHGSFLLCDAHQL